MRTTRKQLEALLPSVATALGIDGGVTVHHPTDGETRARLALVKSPVGGWYNLAFVTAKRTQHHTGTPDHGDTIALTLTGYKAAEMEVYLRGVLFGANKR